jgi:hypothetical protein
MVPLEMLVYAIESALMLLADKDAVRREVGKYGWV